MIKCRIGVTAASMYHFYYPHTNAADNVRRLAEFLDLDETDLKRKFYDFGSKTFATEADMLVYKMSKPEWVIIEIVE